MNGLLAKRLFDVALAAAGLIVLLPLFLAIALAVKLNDKGPVFFQQGRMSRQGRLIKVWKFRTMIPQAEGLGPGITSAHDRRITRIGRLLRRTKMDELPQLWNVVEGSMSLVGPRPELPRYLADYPRDLRPVLDLTAGITDIASLYFRDEESLLASVSNSEHYYRKICLPAKLRMSLVYAMHRSMGDDIKVILRTIIPNLNCRTKAERSEPEIYVKLHGSELEA